MHRCPCLTRHLVHGAVCRIYRSFTHSHGLRHFESSIPHAWVTAACASDGNGPNNDYYDNNSDGGNPCSTGWIGLHAIYQSSTVVCGANGSPSMRSCRVSAFHELHAYQSDGGPSAGVGWSEWLAHRQQRLQRLGGMAMLPLACVSSCPFVVVSVPDPMRMEQSVGLLSVPLDVWSPTGTVGTVDRVTGLAHRSIMSRSLAEATMPRLRQPQSPST